MDGRRDLCRLKAPAVRRHATLVSSRWTNAVGLDRSVLFHTRSGRVPLRAG